MWEKTEWDEEEEEKHSKLWGRIKVVERVKDWRRRGKFDLNISGSGLKRGKGRGTY